MVTKEDWIKHVNRNKTNYGYLWEQRDHLDEGLWNPKEGLYLEFMETEHLKKCVQGLKNETIFRHHKEQWIEKILKEIERRTSERVRKTKLIHEVLDNWLNGVYGTSENSNHRVIVEIIQIMDGSNAFIFE